MPLGPNERRVLTAYQGYRTDGVSPRHFFGPQYIPKATIGYAMIAAGAYYLSADTTTIAVVVGMGIGTIFRDFRYYQLTRGVWPVLSKVIDWNRVDSLLHDHNGG